MKHFFQVQWMYKYLSFEMPLKVINYANLLYKSHGLDSAIPHHTKVKWGWKKI